MNHREGEGHLSLRDKVKSRIGSGKSRKEEEPQQGAVEASAFEQDIKIASYKDFQKKGKPLMETIKKTICRDENKMLGGEGKFRLQRGIFDGITTQSLFEQLAVSSTGDTPESRFNITVVLDTKVTPPQGKMRVFLPNKVATGLTGTLAADGKRTIINKDSPVEDLQRFMGKLKMVKRGLEPAAPNVA
ncbi:MAG TPA: hypothetical protein VNA13_03675 [Xanthomonadales bacterium]|nr:hypothetical protein [Xanthomonadales bacterium]